MIMPEIDQNRAIPIGDLSDSPVEELHPGPDHPAPGQASGDIGPAEKDHVRVVRPQLPDHILETGEHARRVESGAKNVVSAAGETDEIGAHSQHLGNLLVDYRV